MATMLPNIRPQFFDDTTGSPLANGSIETYSAGLSTPKATYSDYSASSANATTLTLNAAGATTVDVWLNGAYKFIIKDSLGNTVGTIDNVQNSIATSSVVGGVLSGGDVSISATGAMTVGTDTTKFNTFLGEDALSSTTGSWCVAVGYQALSGSNTADNNTAVGSNSLTANTSGVQNTAIGRRTLYSNTTGFGNVAAGYSALTTNIAGGGNTGIGDSALTAATLSGGTGIGYYALASVTTGQYMSAVGYQAGASHTTYSNSTCLGANSAVAASNQVQLGDAATTTYAYGAVQDRSDARDKTEIKDTTLGLTFIEAIRPVEFKWNYREDYVENKVKEDGTVETIIHENDGSKTRNRFHQGVIAQEVKEVMDALGVDFAGYKDTNICGGEDRLTIGYTEFIAPLIKAVQELSKKVKELESKCL